MHDLQKIGGAAAQVQIATAFGLIWAALVFAGGLIAINGLLSIRFSRFYTITADRRDAK